MVNTTVPQRTPTYPKNNRNFKHTRNANMRVCTRVQCAAGVRLQATRAPAMPPVATRAHRFLNEIVLQPALKVQAAYASENSGAVGAPEFSDALTAKYLSAGRKTLL